MTLKLVSFKACPFVQRVAITLQYKGIDYDIEYIDLADPPEWFLAISPLKKKQEPPAAATTPAPATPPASTASAPQTGRLVARKPTTRSIGSRKLVV